MRRTWLVAVLLGFATAALRLPRALGDALWQDEVASARIIREPGFAGVLRHVVRTESTPPLWYVLGWIAHQAWLSVDDVRLISVVAGAVVVTVVAEGRMNTRESTWIYTMLLSVKRALTGEAFDPLAT